MIPSNRNILNLVVFVIGLEIMGIIIILIRVIGGTILFSKSIKLRYRLKAEGINEGIIKKVTTFSIWSLVISILSCIGIITIIFPILALILAKIKIKDALLSNNTEKATKRVDLAIVLLIVGNAIVMGSVVVENVLFSLK